MNDEDERASKVTVISYSSLTLYGSCAHFLEVEKNLIAIAPKPQSLATTQDRRQTASQR